MSDPRDRARTLIARAEASCEEIRGSYQDERLEHAEASIERALRLGHVVTAWNTMFALPVGEELTSAALQLAREHPATLAAELRLCRPFNARSLLPRPRTLEDFRAYATCARSTRTPWVAGLYLQRCFETLRHQEPYIIEIGAPPPVPIDEASDALIDALGALGFDVGLRVGLDLIASGLTGTMMVERFGVHFEAVYSAGSRLVARHKDGIDLLCGRFGIAIPNEPPLEVLITSAGCRDEHVARKLRALFLDDLARRFEEDHPRIFDTGATPRGQLLVKSVVYAAMHDLMDGAVWWTRTWNHHMRTFTSWPSKRSVDDHERLLLLAATALAACRGLASQNRDAAVRGLMLVIDRVALHLRDLMLGVGVHEVATRAYVQLIVQGLAFAESVGEIAHVVAIAKAAFVDSLRTSELAGDAVRAAKEAGYEEILGALVSAHRELVSHEAALRSRDPWPC